MADDSDEEVTLATRGRTVSDMMSGMAIDRESHEIYGKFTQEVLESHFTRFKQYDIDNSGFVSVANLKAIFEALDMPEVTDDQCKGMIEEVAILVGHDNDGQLSFRDYCHLMVYEQKKKENAELIEAVEEQRLSMREEEGGDAVDVADAEEEEPVEEITSRMRGSSFAVLETIAVSRIRNFEQKLADIAKKEAKIASGQEIKQRKFDDKVAKFKRLESGGELTAAESVHKQTLKAKLAAFEAASKKDPVAFKLSWKNVRPGSWAQKRQFAMAPPKKKSLAELP